MGASVFVLPVKFDPANPVIFECVERIRRFHPDEAIMVVDSDSDDTSYAKKLDLDAFAPVENRNYGVGAWNFARENSLAEFYFLLYDSVFLNANIDHVRASNLTTVWHFRSAEHDWGWDHEGAHLSGWGGKVLAGMGIDIPPSYTGVSGPMWCCPREVLDQLAAIGYFDVLPKDKWELCAMERVTGIVFEHLGYDVTNSLMGDQHPPQDETYCTKLFLGRM